MATTKYNVGDKITHKKFGKGVIRKIDEYNEEFYYYGDFEDGTKAWLPMNLSKVLVKEK